MKKLLILSVALLLAYIPFEAQEQLPSVAQPPASPGTTLLQQASPPLPGWSDFCPSDICDATGQLLNLQAPKGFFAQKAWKQAAPKRAYWAKRRQQFENEVALCQTTTTDKAMCLLQVRQMETQKNNELQQLELKAQALREARALRMQQHEQHMRQLQQSQENKPLIPPTQYYNCTTMGVNTNCYGY